MNWPDYIATIDDLAEALKRERLRRDGATREQEQARKAIAEVRKKLTAQQSEIIRLADEIQEPRPLFAHETRAGVADMHDAIRMADYAIERARSQYQAAEKAAGRALLFPDMSVDKRNLLVYSAAAALSSIVTYCVLTIASLIAGHQVWPAIFAPLPLLLPPAAAVVLGCVVIHKAGGTRIRKHTVADFRLVAGCLTAFILCLVLRAILGLLH